MVGKGTGNGMGCCESIAAFQLWITNGALALGSLMMLIFGCILMAKYVTGFSVCVMIIGACLAFVAILGFCSATSAASKRVYCYLFFLMAMLITQIVMAIYFSVDPDVVSDNSGCATYDNTTAVTSTTCDPYTTATGWCDYDTCEVSTASCCCSCDKDCKDCLNSVKSVKDFMNDYEEAVTWSLWIVAVIELVALLAGYCKMSYADERKDDMEMNREQEVPEMTNQDMKDKYGENVQKF